MITMKAEIKWVEISNGMAYPYGDATDRFPGIHFEAGEIDFPGWTRVGRYTGGGTLLEGLVSPHSQIPEGWSTNPVYA